MTSNQLCLICNTLYLFWYNQSEFALCSAVSTTLCTLSPHLSRTLIGIASLHQIWPGTEVSWIVITLVFEANTSHVNTWLTHSRSCYNSCRKPEGPFKRHGMARRRRHCRQRRPMAPWAYGYQTHWCINGPIGNNAIHFCHGASTGAVSCRFV